MEHRRQQDETVSEDKCCICKN